MDLRTPGVIISKADTPRSYMVDTTRGRVRRNRFHLLPTDQSSTMGHNCEVVVINEGAEDRAISVVEGISPRLMLAVKVSKDEYFGVIDPHPLYHGLVSTTDDVCTRMRNLDVLLHNIRAFYEEVLGQLLLIKNPDIIILGRQPMEEVCIGEMQAMLLLLLGSAVQCDRKQTFIENIKSLDLEVQHSIVDCIKQRLPGCVMIQITDNPEAVWLSEWNELSNIPPEEQKHMYSVLVAHLRRLIKERDELSQ
ncbi:CCDC88A, partial [Cordylochernes scorpioides]